MNMSTTIRRKLPLIALALVFAAGLSFVTFSDISPAATVHDSSALSAQMSVLGRDVQSRVSFTNEQEPENALGPAIAIGMLGVGATLGAFTIYQCRKNSTDNDK